MRHRFCVSIALLCLSSALYGQVAPAARESDGSDRYQLYGGYSFQSNSFNGVPGHRQPLSGWEASFATRYLWHKVRFKFDTTQYRGNNYNAQQHAYYILGGWQYDHKIAHETIFGQILVGDIGINRYWGPNGHAGQTASFATVVGGGIDTPISRRFAVRLSGDWVYENFALVVAANNTLPYGVPGLPNYFGRASAGVVWKF